MKTLIQLTVAVLLVLASGQGFTAVPMLLNYQGNVVDGTGMPVDGTGYFKFAIVNPAGNTAYWVSNGATMDGSEPPNGVAIPVSNGAFSVKLGDTNLTNMAALTQTVFDNSAIYLRVWFSTNNINFEQFASDIQILSAGFAFKAAVADTVLDSAVTSDTIQNNTITNVDINDSAAISATKIDSAGLDADTLDGINSTEFAASGHNHDTSYSALVHSHNYAGSSSPGGPASDLSCTSCVSSTEIVRSNLDADLLDGIDSSGFSLSSHSHGDWTVSGNNIYSTVSGNVGIGTSTPTAKLHIMSSGAYYPTIESAGTGPFGLVLRNPNRIWYVLHSNGSAESGSFTLYDGTAGQSRLHITLAGNVGIGTTTPAGKLDVNGSIYQRGGVLHADYVYEPNYLLESIEEHASFMWNEKHLKAVPKATVDGDGQEIIEIGAHQKGILEELEKAHIYIDQLNRHIKALEERLAKLEQGS